MLVNSVIWDMGSCAPKLLKYSDRDAIVTSA